MVTTLTTNETVMWVWDHIKTMCIGDDSIGITSTQRVRDEYEMLIFHNREAVKDFTMWLAESGGGRCG
jgi:hypothetical protein